ncbi:sodium- and chloride-dependent betaine transporter-like isoform X2 [Sparus aurata]|uniref:sodium- and chloride-dependent betaine transporter-like isoform X2 n=1 Tax=Sparus aurata TaxID=8175 RepID=UPI0011C1B232|nr:sodium- and chloride-dependent betaine transporter-like isoform X2 [Sparus aurata]
MTEEAARGAPDGDPKSDNGIPEEGGHPRRKWANKMEFLFSVAGQIIGFANIWSFPFLCYVNGGGAFFIPYFILLFFCGMPLFVLETALGQYTSEGGVTAWRKICPMFEGLGMASQVLVMYLNIYYIVILAWTIFYLFSSIKSPLPWTTCENWWNTEQCFSTFSVAADPHLTQPDADWSFLHNITTTSDFPDNFSYALDHKLPENEFYTNRVLGMSGDMYLTNVHWDVALCLLIAWIMCYFCVWKGIRSTGKAVYFTVTFPYLLLVILFFRGVTLPGAWEGLKYYLLPDVAMLARPRIWCDAASHVIHSYALSLGVLTSLGSYNKYNNDCYRDCLALCALNSATSVFAGVVVFSFLGFMVQLYDIPIEEFASGGVGMAFISFPKILSSMPVSSFWAVVFFLMILFLGLDTQFVFVESLATSITDMFPHHLRRPHARELLVLVIAVVCFLLGLPLLTDGGIVLFHMVDAYGLSRITLFIIACLETIVIAWVYVLFSSSFWQLKVSNFLISISILLFLFVCLLTSTFPPP